jgi:hypothetical protein
LGAETGYISTTTWALVNKVMNKFSEAETFLAYVSEVPCSYLNRIIVYDDVSIILFSLRRRMLG